MHARPELRWLGRAAESRRCGGGGGAALVVEGDAAALGTAPPTPTAAAAAAATAALASAAESAATGRIALRQGLVRGRHGWARQSVEPAYWACPPPGVAPPLVAPAALPPPPHQRPAAGTAELLRWHELLLQGQATQAPPRNVV